MQRNFSFILCLLAATANFAAAASSGDVWHIPFNTETGIPSTMRDQYVEIDPTGTATIYQGFFKDFGGANGNQIGGTLSYRIKQVDPDLGWQSAALGFHADEGLNQFWKADLDLGATGLNAGQNDVIEYYVFVDFDDSGSDPDDTYIYGGDLNPGIGNQLNSTNQADARANPYSFRNRPAWIFHSNNRVLNGDNVQFWAQVGYIGDTNDLSTRWADMGTVYYSTDGVDPAGALGVAGNGSTQVASFVYDHPEQNQIDNGSITGGTGMWWAADVSNLLQGLPLGSTIKYRIGFWHSGTNEEKFADHNAGADEQIFSFMNGALGDPVLTIFTPTNGTLNANYTTTKLYVDEIAADSIPVTITFAPGQANITPGTVQVVTNLNQRHRADADKNGNDISDGQEWNQNAAIIGPSADDTYYYQSHVMTTTATPGEYSTVINATKTGAYRLTARWKVDGDPAWRQYTAFGRRDHAVTVAPTEALNICLYEINTLSVEAKDSGGGFIERSTFEDLYDAPNALRTVDGKNFNLTYLQGLGVNWLWFQPVHLPSIAGREVDPATSMPYNPGSPYSIKNFFEINSWMSANMTGADPYTTANRAAGMTSFQAFVNAADTANIEIMLDAPFNHTGYDVELAQAGLDLFEPDGQTWSSTDEIRTRDSRFFSKGDIFTATNNDYCQRAAGAGNIGPAPDRGDFGKWSDVFDVYFGRYDSLVCTNPADNGSYLNEGDQFWYTDTNWTSNDYVRGGINRNTTQNTWKYFKEYALFWLDKTGYPAGTPHTAANRNKGIDGLRCDFGQGLPPQAWEYIINCARTRKWNFVMMSESLDGGAVTYRSNRHFDILNENIVFPLKNATDATAYRNLFEGRRNAYGQGLVLINNTSHDEENYVDPFEALIRYSVAGTVDGVPMIFMGQELGVSRTFGFTFYETNFGKQIAHFKKFNSMDPIWNDADFGNDQLYQVYAGINAARKFSPALRSKNRFFMDGDGFNGNLFAVAKYQTPGGSPAFNDAVLAFANVDRNNNQADNFHISGFLKSQLGLKDGRSYNVKNVAAYLGQVAGRRDINLWPDDDADPSNGVGLKGSTLDAGAGVFVSLNKVPTTVGEWTTAPFEASYLKLFDVTPPPSPAPMPPLHYAIGTGGAFSWSNPGGPDDNITTYVIDVGTTPGGNDLVDDATVTDGSNTFNFTGSFGSVYYATITSESSAGVAATSSGSSDIGDPNPASSTTPLILLDPSGDQDLDGRDNNEEDIAGTNPLNGAEFFVVADAVRQAGGGVDISFESVLGRTYTLECSSDLGDTDPWADTGLASIAGSGAIKTFVIPGPAPGPRKFYRIIVRKT